MISILILTKNEEADLVDCLRSVSWSDDIHVFDSVSTDTTCEIAINHGAKVTQRVFDNYSSQRNAANTQVNFKYDWVLSLDADERVTPLLREELQAFVKDSQSVHYAAGQIRRIDFLFGSSLMHAQITPYYIRLYRPKLIAYSREINETVTVTGKLWTFKNSFNHYPFSKGITHWIEKHNKYSSMEAARSMNERKLDIKFSLYEAVFNKHLHIRRYHQKGLYYKTPFRPIIKFFYMMVIRRAFLDGYAGFTYALLQSIYEYFICLKEREFTGRA